MDINGCYRNITPSCLIRNVQWGLFNSTPNTEPYGRPTEVRFQLLLPRAAPSESLSHRGFKMLLTCLTFSSKSASLWSEIICASRICSAVAWRKGEKEESDENRAEDVREEKLTHTAGQRNGRRIEICRAQQNPMGGLNDGRVRSTPLNKMSAFWLCGSRTHNTGTAYTPISAQFLHFQWTVEYWDVSQCIVMHIVSWGPCNHPPQDFSDYFLLCESVKSRVTHSRQWERVCVRQKVTL